MSCMKYILGPGTFDKVWRRLGSCRCFHAELVRTCFHSVQACVLLKGKRHHSLSSSHTLTWQVRQESNGLPIIHHSKYVCDLPANHRFPMGKFPRVLHFLIKDQVITENQVGMHLTGKTMWR